MRAAGRFCSTRTRKAERTWNERLDRVCDSLNEEFERRLDELCVAGSA